MADNYDREERRARRRLRRRDYECDTGPPERPVSALGVVGLVTGIFALVVSLIPCFGAVAIPVAAIALFLSLLSLVVARQSRHAMGVPIAATAVSGSAMTASLLWIALLGAMLNHSEDRTVSRPAPVPVGAPNPAPPPRKAQPELKKPANPKADDAAFEKKLLEDLAKDRIKETIRNGPGVAVTAADLEDEFDTNPIAADAQYKNKVLAASGKVVRVVSDEAKGHYVLELATGNPTKTVSCEFTAPNKHMLVSCKRGDEVKVRGLCAGRVNEFVKLTDCVVAK